GDSDVLGGAGELALDLSSSFTYRAAEEVRVHHQSENSQADRPDDSAECARESGQGDSINRARIELNSPSIQSYHSRPCSEKTVIVTPLPFRQIFFNLLFFLRQ